MRNRAKKTESVEDRETEQHEFWFFSLYPVDVKYTKALYF